MKKFYINLPHKSGSIKKYYMNLPLKYKITAFNFLIIFAVVIFLWLFFYRLYSANVQSELGDYQVQNVGIIKNDIELAENNIDSLSTSLLLNQSFQNLLSFSPDQVANLQDNYSNLNTAVNLALNALVTNDYISYISVYTQNGYSFYYSKNVTIQKTSYDVIKASQGYKQELSMLGSPLWITISTKDSAFILNNDGPKLTMLRSILNTNSYTPQGFMIVGIDWSKIWSYVPQEGTYAFLMTDDTGHVITSAVNYPGVEKLAENGDDKLPELISSPNKSEIELDGDKYLFVKTEIDSGYYIISLTPMQLVMKTVNSKNLELLLAMLVCLAVSLVCSFFTSSLVTNPVKKLIGSIKKARGGDLSKKVSFIYNDEIGVLGREYNSMLDELNRLFNRIYQLEIRNRESVIKALQDQINPHFLYNTLDSIYLKATNSNDNETAEMVYSLARIFRLTLNRGDDLTTVRNEKDFIENYLLLQKIRFKDRFDYTIDFDEELLDLKIPKLILQPFVENAIVHTLGGTRELLELAITGFVAEDGSVFVIKDNGCGIDQALLDEILNGDEDNKEHGFAIRNVKERLKLYYGGRVKEPLTIASSPGVGTTVKIKIPKGGTEHVKAFDR